MVLSVLYEDNFLIAINKENGISVIPGRGDTSSPPLVQIVEKESFFMILRTVKRFFK
jgi:23S rRNA-/tRNA-specific pseudouridylate synthase